MQIKKNMVPPQVSNQGIPQATNQPVSDEAVEMQGTSNDEGKTERNNIIVKFVYDVWGKDIDHIDIIDDGKEEVTVVRTDELLESWYYFDSDITY